MSSFVSNVLKLVSGSLVVQILGLLLVPVISRMYSPADFGVFQLFVSIAGILATLSALSYHFSIVLPEDDADAANVLALCFVLVVLTSVLSLSLYALSSAIADYFNSPTIRDYLLLVPLAVFLSGFYTAFTYWMSRRERFGTISACGIFNVMSGKAVQIMAGLGSPGAFGLIGGYLAGYAAALLVAVSSLRKDFFRFAGAVSFGRMKQMANRYKKFPQYNVWSSLANVVSVQLPVFMLAFFFNPVVVGFFSFAYTVINVPMGLIGNATGQVFYKKASDEKNRRGDLKALINNVYVRLIAFGVFPMVVLLVAGEDLFGFVFGDRWNSAGLYAKILIPWTFLVFVSSPLSGMFSVLEKQEIGLSFNLLLLFSRIFALYLGGIYGDPVFALAFFSLTGVVFWGWMNLYLLKLSGVRRRDAFGLFMKYFAYALLAAAPVALSKYLSLPAYIIFGVSVLTAASYYLLVLMRDSYLKKELLGVVAR